MSKDVKIIEPCKSQTFSRAKTPTIIDWEKCVLCQESTSETLQCPAALTRSDVQIGAGYISLAKDIESFQEVGNFPILINFDLLNEGEGVAKNLTDNNAKWHKTCRNKFSKLKLKRALKRKSHDEEEIASTSSKVTRQSLGGVTLSEKNKCFFCGEKSGILHNASTFRMDSRVRGLAHELQDTVLLAKLSAGDLISQDAVYHTKCLTSLANRARKVHEEDNESVSDKQIKGIALAELISYIEDVHTDPDTISVFKLADLGKLYTDRLKQLGLQDLKRIHTTKLKIRLLSNIPGLKAYKQGRDVLLAFDEDIGSALKMASLQSYDDDAIILAKAAKIIRKDMFQQQSYKFDGKFGKYCQQNAVPESLKTLTRMILGGPNIETQAGNFVETQATLTIAQTIIYNSYIHRKHQTSTYHSKDREPPLPIYLGLMIHAKTRKKKLIDKLYNFGLSVSYDRVLELSTDLGNSVCSRYRKDNVVCPLSLRKGLFTTGAVDNIDHNPSSATNKGSFHGTGISIFQHLRDGSVGESRDVDPISTDDPKLKKLPESYTNVPPVGACNQQPEIPEARQQLTVDCPLIPSAIKSEYRWLEHVRLDLCTENSEDEALSWSAFHASQIPAPNIQSSPDISSLLPLFEDQAKSVAMIRHSMNIIRQVTHFLNPWQTPVIACDQPLFALAKQIQWNWPDTYGEHNYVVMFGGLHIEMAAWKTVGDWLEDSGWTNALSQSNIATAGTADAFLKAVHLKKTRHAHQITASSLYRLMYHAYIHYVENTDNGNNYMEFDDWRLKRESESPQFLFWSTTLKLELSVLIFVRALREGNFKLYKESLITLVPWFFALDHPNYARWISVHIRDMLQLDTISPETVTEFESGTFVVNKTQHVFSSIPIDHAHEQNNKMVKGDGGAIGLTENSSELLRWMVSGPELARRTLRR